MSLKNHAILIILKNLQFSVGKKYGDQHLSEMVTYLSSRYEASVVMKACNIYLAKGKPYLAQVCELEEIIKSMTYDTADQAWSKCMIARDERKSLMISSVALECYDNVSELYEYDKIGARRAFIDEYNKLMLTRSDSEKRLRLSLGSDPALREHAIAKALSAGVITQERAKLLNRGATASAMTDYVPKLLEKPNYADKKHTETTDEYRKRKWKENVKFVREALNKKTSKVSVDS